MKLGITLFNFCSEIKNDNDLECVLTQLKELGCNVVQVSGISQIPNAKVAELCNKYGMEVCVTHTAFDRLMTDLNNVIEEHKVLGCKNIGLGCMPKEYQNAQGYKKFIEDLTPVAQKIKAAGLQFAYHNHAFEFQHYNGRRGYDILLEDTDPELFNFIADTHWFQTGGVNPPEYIEKLTGRMKVCHFKDYQIIDNEREFAEIGLGNLDLDKCYRACMKAGVEYVVIEQDSCPGAVIDSMKISFPNLQKIKARNE